MSTLKVNTINAATSGQAVAVDISNPRSFRNLVINGAMNIAQRGTSSTTSGYGTVDRWRTSYSGHNEVLTQAQHALTSSDTGPWEKGFRNSYHITNGHQTSGADDADYMNIQYKIEAQDIANSGWEYTSTSSYITLSFWIKSSIGQNFYFYLKTIDGTGQSYPFETGSLSANTWTKITKTIPGHANLQFDNNNDNGLVLNMAPFWGTDYTNSSVSLNAWAAYADATRTPDSTVTWWTTNDSTFELTGVQLEVGEYATDFEHRTYGDELARCQRYFYRSKGRPLFAARTSGATAILIGWPLPVPFRAEPSITQDDDDDNGNFTMTAFETNGTSPSTNTPTVMTRGYILNHNQISLRQDGHSVVDDRVVTVYQGGGYIDFTAEL